MICWAIAKWVILNWNVVFRYGYSVFQKFPHTPRKKFENLAPLDGRSTSGPYYGSIVQHVTIHLYPTILIEQTCNRMSAQHTKIEGLPFSIWHPPKMDLVSSFVVHHTLALWAHRQHISEAFGLSCMHSKPIASWTLPALNGVSIKRGTVKRPIFVACLNLGLSDFRFTIYFHSHF